MLNAIGLQNEGVAHFRREILPPLEGVAARVIVSVAGASAGEYVEVAGELDEEARIDALELNISCPNVKEGGIAFGVSAEATESLVRAVRERTGKPLFVKLSPNVADIRAIARAAEAGGADAVVVANTLLGMAVDVEKRRPVLANVTGGLSGPAIRPVALRLTWQVAGAVGIPVIGCGGIASAEDVVAFLLCGASAVEVGTMNFVDPPLAGRLPAELGEWLSARGETVESLIGRLET